MKIDKIEIKNYKSLRNVPIDFNDLIVFIGKNNTGKSNIFDTLNFLLDSRENGLKWAYDKRGGDFREIVYGKDVKNQIEIVISFTMSHDERERIIEKLFKSNTAIKAEKIMDSPFLKTLKYSVKLTKNGFSEEMITPNIEEGELSIIKIEGGTDDHKVESTNLQDVCEKLPGESNIPSEYSSHGSGRGVRLMLFQVGMSRPPRPEQEIASLLWEGFMKKYYWVSPTRKSDISTGISGEKTLDSEAKNLADVLHTLYTNDPDRYKEIASNVKKIVPEMEDLLHPTTGNRTTIGIREKGFSKGPIFTLEHISSGIKNALAVVTKVISVDEGSVIGIEEPEIYLHPTAQRELFWFLKKESTNKKILMTTHSPIFASCVELENTRLVTKDEKGQTNVESVTEGNVYKIIKELGIRPSDFFDYDVAVFVEGLFDVEIFKAFARKLKPRSKIGFIDAEGWNSMHYYANAKVLSSKRVKIPVFTIFDGDTEKEEKRKKIKARLLKELSIDKDHIITLSKSSIEDYLLVPRTIKKAFPELKRSEEEITDYFNQRAKKKNKKAVLDSFFKENGLGKYSNDKGARIADAMEQKEIDKEICGIMKGFT